MDDTDPANARSSEERASATNDPELRVRRILETCLYAHDLVATATFYGEVFGLGEVSRVEGRHVFFQRGNQMVLLFQPEATSGPVARFRRMAHRAPATSRLPSLRRRWMRGPSTSGGRTWRSKPKCRGATRGDRSTCVTRPETASNSPRRASGPSPRPIPGNPTLNPWRRQPLRSRGRGHCRPRPARSCMRRRRTARRRRFLSR